MPSGSHVLSRLAHASGVLPRRPKASPGCLQECCIHGLTALELRIARTLSPTFWAVRWVPSGLNLLLRARASFKRMFVCSTWCNDDIIAQLLCTQSIATLHLTQPQHLHFMNGISCMQTPRLAHDRVAKRERQALCFYQATQVYMQANQKLVDTCSASSAPRNIRHLTAPLIMSSLFRTSHQCRRQRGARCTHTTPASACLRPPAVH